MNRIFADSLTVRIILHNKLISSAITPTLAATTSTEIINAATQEHLHVYKKIVNVCVSLFINMYS